MTNILLVRRPRLGAGSSLGLAMAAKESTTLNDTLTTYPEILPSNHDLIVRWGCTASIAGHEGPVFNRSAAIHHVNDKQTFAETVARTVSGQLPVMSSSVTSDVSSIVAMMESISSSSTRWVLRTRNHAQGRRMYRLSSMNTARVFKRYQRLLQHGWYARPRIEKAKEFRVYVVAGKVACVAEKTPGDRSKTAWNVARGGRFDMVRWDDWPLDVCDLAIKCFNVSDLNFGGVDIMVEEGTNKPYFIEINTAPSLPLTSDGGITSRHRSMMGAFEYHAQRGVEHIDPDAGGYEPNNWRKYIHPGVWDNHVLNRVE